MKKLLLAGILVIATALPAHASQAHWEIGFTVHTIRPTNVSVHYILRCSNGTETRKVDNRLQTRTPVVRHLQPTLVDATSCHIRVVAWDKKPFATPNNPRPPLVESWAEAV